MSTMNNILILGGTGFVGRHVCELLNQHGMKATVPTRRVANARSVQHLPSVTVLEADVHAPGVLEKLLPSHSAVLNLVAILQGKAARFEAVHVGLPRRLLAAIQTVGGPRRVVHVSALGASLLGPSRYQHSKAEGEAVLGAAASQGQLQLTLLQPSIIFGAGDSFLNLFAKLQKVFPLMPLAGANARMQPVWVQDVAAAIVECLQSPDTIGKTYELVGPDVFTLRQLVQMAGSHSGHPRPVLALPGWAGYVQALALELAPGEPLMSRDNLLSLQTDNIASGKTPGLADLGITPTSLHAIAPQYLGGQGTEQRMMGYRKRVRG
jgi:uncharacterized protein YbjT (DUF2867 family)